MEEIVMYFLARKDLKMSPGKLAAQVGHGVQYVLTRLQYTESQEEDLTLWKAGSSAKIVLAVESLAQFTQLKETLAASPIPYAVVIDEGRTEIEPNTETLLALSALPRSRAVPLVGYLPLYR